MSSGWRRVATSHRLDAAFAIDPYYVWADLSGWAAFEQTIRVRVMLELAFDPNPGPAGWPGALLQALATPATDPTAALSEVEALLGLNGVTVKGKISRYHVWPIARDQLPTLTCLVEAGVLARFQLGLTRSNFIEVGDLQTLANLTGAVTVSDEGDIPVQVVGVVDDGPCVAHEWLRSASGSSHFALVWDQNTTRVARGPWQRFEGIHYGEELSHDVITKHLQANPELGEPGEAAFYDAIQRSHWGLPGRTHGTGVLHMALHSWRRPADEPKPVMPVIFVQLPVDTVKDTSGGSLGVYLLDGVRYVVGRARELRGQLESQNHGRTVLLRSVVNVSLGSIAGSHDGTSMTERALAELADEKDVAIVLAAGNTAGRGVHAKRRLAPGASAEFFVQVLPDTERESYVELWLPTDGLHVLAEEFSLEVSAPDGSSTGTVNVGDAWVLERAGETLAAVVFARRVAQGEYGTMVLLALRGTQSREPLPSAPYGLWSIRVHSRSDTAVQVHAWVERNDILVGRRTPQQTRFADDGSGYLDDAHTLSSIASGECVCVVGAYRWNEREASDYSAQGPACPPGPRLGPDLYAPADQSASVRGLAVPGFHSGQWSRMSGTSVAAPQVQRWLLSDKPASKIKIRGPDGQEVDAIPLHPDDAEAL